MKSICKKLSLTKLSILTLTLFPSIILGKGAVVGASPDGKMQVSGEVPEEEYRKWPGENNSWKLGNKWVVPDVVGYDYDNNISKLIGDLRKFKIGKIKRVVSDHPKGRIISQNPKAKELVDNPGFVDFEVSDGPRK